MKKTDGGQPFQEYSFYDICTRLDKIIQMLEKIIDQNEKTIESLEQDKKETKNKELLNSLETQNKKIMELLELKSE